MFVNPSQVIADLGLAGTEHVADFGAGSGAFALSAAKVLQQGDGRVYAVDIQKDLLLRLINMAKIQKLSNVEIIHGDIEHVGGTKLGAESMDAVIISNTLFQIENKKEAATEAFRVLKKGGRALVIEWLESFGGLGPPPEAVAAQKDIRLVFLDAGFTHERDIPAGQYHYGDIFRKP
ncbi:methyltransferase domain-containing protein [bacterium]|nr:methyltransferase domain-containing protein [bacterium]MCI0679850.1 methyltransferase domain-containing protein [bacterium]